MLSPSVRFSQSESSADEIEPLGDLEADWICDPAGSVILLKQVARR